MFCIELVFFLLIMFMLLEAEWSLYSVIRACRLCLRDTAGYWSFKYRSRIVIYLPTSSAWKWPDLISLRYYSTWTVYRPSLSGYSWSAKLPKKLFGTTNVSIRTKEWTLKMIWLKLGRCFRFLRHLFQIFCFPFLYLFIFIFCEVKMDRSFVNVAKGKPRYTGASKLLCNNKR